MKKYTIDIEYGLDHIKVHREPIRASPLTVAHYGEYEVTDNTLSGGIMLMRPTQVIQGALLLVAKESEEFVRSLEFSPEIPETSEDDVITVIQGRDCKLLTFHCPHCGKYHSVAVRMRKEKLPLTFSGESWMWNGNLVRPTLTPSCVANGPCHCYIEGGTGRGYDGIINTGYQISRKPLLKVKDWPRKKPKEG